MALLFKFGLWLAQWPGPRMAWRISGWLAALLWVCGSEAARITRINVRVCFPELSEIQQRTMVRESLQHMTLLFFELAHLTHWPAERLLGQIREVRGKGLLDEVVQSGHGTVLLVPHFGNWEIFCAYLGSHYCFAALYDPPKLAGLESAILKSRQRFGGELFAIDTAGMRKLLRVLREGKLVAVLPDQVPDRSNGVYAPFFGLPALTMTLAHRLIVKNGHAALLGSVERVVSDAGYHYRLCIEPLVAETSGTEAQAFAGILNQSIEQVVQRAPAQYQWEYKRFKRPPEKEGRNIYLRQ